MIIHNRMRFVGVGGLMLMLLALMGAGCVIDRAGDGKTGRDGGGVAVPAIPTPDAGAPGTSGQGGGVASVNTPTAPVTAVREWTEYRSDTLGIVIPYPAGWVVQRDEEDRSADFYDGTPPSSSDQPSAMWYQERDGTLDQVIRDEFPTVLERQETQHSGIQMTRITYPYDARLRPDEVMAAYLWAEVSGSIKMIGGPKDSAVIEYVVDHLEVRP